MSATGRKRQSKITALFQVPSGAEQPHEAFANLRDDPDALATFRNRFSPVLSPAELKHRGPGPELPFDAPKSVEVIRDMRNTFRKAWQGDRDAVAWVQFALNRQSFGFTAPSHRITLEPKTLFGTVCLLFLRDYLAGRLALCINPDCQAPYFVRKRKTQKYCESGPCKEQAQREQKREWWTRHRGKGSK
jgi:hypothetical protein